MRHEYISRNTAKRIYIIVVLFMLLTLLTACNYSKPIENGVQITDMLGRTVTIPADPQRIAGLDPFAGQVIIMFGYGDRMMATVGGVKRDLLLQSMCPELVNAANVKEEGAINAEQLLSLDIDLIFIKGEVYQKTSEREKLDKLGIPYLVIDYSSMEEQCNAAKLIGEAFGKYEKAESYVKYYQDTIKKISELTSAIPDKEKPSLYHSINIAIRTDTNGSLGAEWIAVTGAKNVSLGASLLFGEKNYNTTLEEIFVWNPDIIICNESGVNEYMLSDSKWLGLRAVREKRVYQIPIGVSRMGHPNSIETPLAIWWLADLLYPEYMTGFDFRQELKDFYRNFFDYIVDEETIDNIISGKGIRTSGVSSDN